MTSPSDGRDSSVKTPLIEGAWSREGLEDLLARVEGAEGADRELDADLTGALLGGEIVWKETRWTGELNPAHRTPSTNHMSGFAHEPVYPLTASLDASHDLAKRHGFYVRSEPRFHIDGERVDFVSYALRPRWNDWRPDDEWFDRGEGRHADQARSVLAALLRALIAQAETPLPTRIDEEN